MERLATALAASIVHIAYRAASSDDEEDGDVEALEAVANLLASASESEISELERAASRLAAESNDAERKKQFEQMMEHLGLGG